MAFLLIVIQVIFWFVFYALGRQYETIFFIVCAIVFFIYFSFLSGSKKQQKDDTEEHHIDTKELTKNAGHLGVILLKQSSLYLSSFLFYAALLGISYSFSDPEQGTIFQVFEYVMLFVSGTLLTLYVLLYKKNIEQIFLLFRSNVLIISAIYTLLFIFLYVYNLHFSTPFFVMNILLSLCWLYIVLITDTYVFEHMRRCVFAWTLMFMFFVVLFLGTQYFYEAHVYYVFVVTAIGVGGVYYFLFPPLFLLWKNSCLARQEYQIFCKLSGIALTLCAHTFLVANLFFLYFSFWKCLLLLLVLIGFHGWVHRRYGNYPAFLLILISIMGIYVHFLGDMIISGTYMLFFVSALLFPLATVVWTYAHKIRLLDMYVLHYTGLIFMVVATVIGMRHIDPSIFALSVLLLAESAIWYMSYIQTKQTHV